MEKVMVNQIEYACYKTDAEMNIIEVNEQFEKMTGYTAEDIKTRRISQFDLIFPEDLEVYGAMVGENVAKTGEAFIEHRIRCKDGAERFVFCFGQNFTEPDGTSVNYIRFIDVTNLVFMRIQAENIRKENDDELEQWIKLANTDELTNVLRRGGFLPTINAFVEEEDDYTLFLLDVDDFKNVNDFCGHPTGDQVLKALANVFKEIVADRGFVCRMGGDEFAIFLKKVGSVEEAGKVATQIIEQVNTLQYITEGKAPIHVSIGGVAHNKESDYDLKKMFVDIDENLYEAKKNGKNQYVIK